MYFRNWRQELLHGLGLVRRNRSRSFSGYHRTGGISLSKNWGVPEHPNQGSNNEQIYEKQMLAGTEYPAFSPEYELPESHFDENQFSNSELGPQILWLAGWGRGKRKG